MIFKDEPRMRNEFWEIHPKLRALLCLIDLWAKANGEEATVTCLLRSHEEQRLLFETGASKFPPGQDIHEVGRAADLRLFKSSALNTILDVSWNEKYPYDTARPTLKTFLFHGGTGQHCHVQICEGFHLKGVVG